MAVVSMLWDDGNSHNHSFTRETSSARFTILGEWDDRFTIRDEWLWTPYSDLSKISNSGVDSVDKEAMRCTSVSFVPYGYDHTTDYVDKVKVNLEYTPGYPFSHYNLVENWILNVQVSGEALTLKPNKWRWKGGKVITTDDDVNAVKTFPQIEAVYTGYFSDSTWTANKNMIAAFEDCIGKTNATPFLGDNNENTLLLTGVEANQISTADGYYWEINYHFGHKRETWNKFWNQSDNTMTEIVSVGATSESVFSDANFNQLNPSTW